MAATQIKTTGIADGAITTAKIPDGAITAAKIASGAASAVTVASSNPAVGSEGSLLYNTTTDVLYVSNGSAWLTVANSAPVTTGGTVTINSLAAGGTFNYNLGLNFADDSSNDGQLAYTLHAGTLPGGCTLPSFGNSAFTGTATDPATDTTFNFTIRGTDSSGAFGIQAYQQTVTNSPPTATGGTVTIPAALRGSTFNYNLGLNFTDATSTDAQLAYTLQSGSLPGGCTLPSSGNSAFTGTSNAAGTFNFVIRATDASNRFVDQTYTQVVTVPPFAATGGTITTVGSYKVHTFTSSGTFTPNQAASNIDIMWVAGGAGGGGGRHGGGGGAGGMRTLTGQTVAATGYTVTIGAGGTRGYSGSSTYTGTNGSNTSINFPTSLTNLGGGGGGSWSGGDKNGQSGGSGGGVGYGATIGYGTSGQGNNGGTYGTQSPYYGSGGGGGKGAVGANGTSNVGGGAGGVGGTNNYRTGSNVYYAGGGGGASWHTGTPGAGGTGGGGAGNITNNQASAGTANTGGGGGGTAGDQNTGSGGNGGSGILIIRYPS